VRQQDDGLTAPMPNYSGKFQYLDEAGGTIDQGACEVSFDAEACLVTPAGGTPLAFDLGDFDCAAPAEWELRFTVFTGRTLLLRQFGAAFGRMSEELLAAWRDRTVRCLLLEDLAETGRYTGAANGVPAEIRIFRSNLAILPQSGTPRQWRLAEIDSCRFDSAAYQVVMESAGERLVLSKLAKKTDEAFGKLRAAIDALHTQAARALHDLFPFLNTDQLRKLQQAMPEGRSCPVTTLASIHANLPAAIEAQAIEESLRPYFESLRAVASGPVETGFKMITVGDAAEGEEEPDAGGESEGAKKDERPLFFWYFFPLANGLAAWEATTGSGRATYLFRAPSPAGTAIARLTRGLALVNFRREPVYLPDASLEQQARYHRYAIGARKLPELRDLRAAFVGRAAHTTPENHKAQIVQLTAGR
jgi:hypothetical protein